MRGFAYTVNCILFLLVISAGMLYGFGAFVICGLCGFAGALTIMLKFQAGLIRVEYDADGNVKEIK